MSKLDSHERLLERWSKKGCHKDQGFVADGIIDPDSWNKAKRKILFLLKEAYLEHPKDRKKSYPENDYRKWLKRWIVDRDTQPVDSKNRRTWQTLTEWAEIALNAQAKQSLRSNHVESPLLACAVINIKKSNGRKTSDPKELKKYAACDRAEIQEQIALIKPDIIICGNTWNAFKTVYELQEKDFSVQKTSEEFKTLQITKEGCLGGCKIIAFCHPNHRYSKSEINDQLTELLS